MDPPRRGRPPLQCEVVVVQLKVHLRRGEDDDLIALFEHMPRRQWVNVWKAALRHGHCLKTQDDSETDAALVEALDKLVL